MPVTFVELPAKVFIKAISLFSLFERLNFAASKEHLKKYITKLK